MSYQLIKVFTEGTWSVVRDNLMEDISGNYYAIVIHTCPVDDPIENKSQFRRGTTCIVCGSAMPDSIKTLIILNNSSEYETRYHTREAP